VPKYLVMIGRNGRFVDKPTAVAELGNKYTFAEVGRIVLEDDGFSARNITGSEEAELYRLSDEYSENK